MANTPGTVADEVRRTRRLAARLFRQRTRTDRCLRMPECRATGCCALRYAHLTSCHPLNREKKYFSERTTVVIGERICEQNSYEQFELTSDGLLENSHNLLVINFKEKAVLTVSQGIYIMWHLTRFRSSIIKFIKEKENSRMRLLISKARKETKKTRAFKVLNTWRLRRLLNTLHYYFPINFLSP